MVLSTKEHFNINFTLYCLKQSEQLALRSLLHTVTVKNSLSLIGEVLSGWPDLYLSVTVPLSVKCLGSLLNMFLTHLKVYRSLYDLLAISMLINCHLLSFWCRFVAQFLHKNSLYNLASADSYWPENGKQGHSVTNIVYTFSLKREHKWEY